MWELDSNPSHDRLPLCEVLTSILAPNKKQASLWDGATDTDPLMVLYAEPEPMKRTSIYLVASRNSEEVIQRNDWIQSQLLLICN